MRIRKADWMFLLGAGLLVLLLSLLPSPRARNPAVPLTPSHRGLTSERDCVRCHAVGYTRPLPDRHPKRQDCFRCHRQARSGETGSGPGTTGKG